MSLISLLILFCVHKTLTKSFTPCELAIELQVYNLTLEQTRNFLCISGLSGMNTNVIGGSRYGIFQIDKRFCNEGSRKGEICDKIECNDLLNNNISDAVSCAADILQERGLNAWRLNKLRCQKKISKFEKLCFKSKIDRCEYAKKLSSLYKINKLEALMWACISEFDEEKLQTSNTNEKTEQTCDVNHDVECAIKNAGKDFSHWPSYNKCQNVSAEDVTKCFKNVEVIFSNGKKFTTSTEISIVFDEDFKKKKLKSASTDQEKEDRFEITNKYNLIHKCHLAESLKNFENIQKQFISTFVCIAEHESELNISLITTKNGTSKYGLFQIDADSYCSTNEKINEFCDILCAHLNDDQFNNDLECVKRIFEKEGFEYWPSYVKHCNFVEENSLDHCFNMPKPTTTHRPFTIVNNFKSVDFLAPTEKYFTTTAESFDSENKFCEFVNFLHKNKIVADSLAIYACIKNENNNNLGPFNIKEKHCNAGVCMINCTNLMDDQFVDDIECAKKIYHEYGLADWNLNHEICEQKYNSKILQCVENEKLELSEDEIELMREENSNEKISSDLITSTKENGLDSYYMSVFEIFTTLKTRNKN